MIPAELRKRFRGKRKSALSPVMVALEGAAPFEKNAYKVDVAKSYIKSAVLRAAD